MLLVLKPTFVKTLPKLILFILFVVLVIVPSIVIYSLNDHENSLADDPLTPIAWCTAPYLFGVIFFSASFPESCAKSSCFDNIG